MGHSVAAQAVCEETPRLVLPPAQKSLEEVQRCRHVASILHEDVQHHPVLVRRTPEIVLHPIDPDEHLVEVPCVCAPGSLSGEVPAELPAPMADALVGHGHASFGQDQLDVPPTEAEHAIQPEGVVGDLGREAMARIGSRLRHLPDSLARFPSGREPRIKLTAPSLPLPAKLPAGLVNQMLIISRFSRLVNHPWLLTKKEGPMDMREAGLWAMPQRDNAPQMVRRVAVGQLAAIADRVYASGDLAGAESIVRAIYALGEARPGTRRGADRRAGRPPGSARGPLCPVS